MPGVQTLLPLLLDHMNAVRLSLARLIDLTSAGPARIYGIARKGRIAVGFDADFSIVEADRNPALPPGHPAPRAELPRPGKVHLHRRLPAPVPASAHAPARQELQVHGGLPIQIL